MPANPKLKDPKDFRLIGQEKVVTKLDTADKTNGKALFTLDVYEPDMLTVVVAHPPRFGATPQRVDDKAARAIPGVVDVKPISTGVAVYATGMWAALKGRDALKVMWDESKAEKRSSAELIDALAAKAATPGVVAASHGDVDAALKSGAKIVEAEYRFPYLAHAPMEPRDGVMKFDGAKVRRALRLADPDAGSDADREDLRHRAGECHDRNAAGRRQFRPARRSGRRSAWRTLRSDQSHWTEPWVKLVWTREDDIGGGFYRPIFVHKMRAAIDGDRIVAWSDTIASPSIGRGTAMEAAMLVNGVDNTMVEGAKELPYDIPNFRCDAHIVDGGPRVLFWRSVGSTHTAFVVETFLDELLTMMGKDPVEGRLAMMGKAPREAGVLRAVAELAGWPHPARQGGRAASRSPNPSTLRRPDRGSVASARMASRASTRSGARSIAASPSIPTSFARRWRAASGTALAISSMRRCDSTRAAPWSAISTPIAHCASMKCRTSRCASCPRPSRRPASANPACRRSDRPSPMRWRN